MLAEAAKDSEQAWRCARDAGEATDQPELERLLHSEVHQGDRQGLVGIADAPG